MKQRNVLLLIQPAYPERIQGIARFAKSHGWHLTIVDRLARFPRGWRGDGALVTLRGNAETNRFVRGLVSDGVPVVDLTFNHPEICLPRVSGDHEAFGRLDLLGREVPALPQDLNDILIVTCHLIGTYYSEKKPSPQLDEPGSPILL